MTTTSAIRRKPATDDAYTLLEHSMVTVLETYANAHTEQDVELMLDRLMEKSRIPAEQWRNYLARREADVYHKTRNLVNIH